MDDNVKDVLHWFQFFHFAQINIYKSHRSYGSHRMGWLKPHGGAGLDGHGTQDRGYHCSDEFQHLSNGAPIDFNHFHTDLVINNIHTDLTDPTDLFKMSHRSHGSHRFI